MAGINEINQIGNVGAVQVITPLGMDTAQAAGQMYEKYMESIRGLYNMMGAGFTDPAALEEPKEVAEDPVKKVDAAKNLFLETPTANPQAPAGRATPGVERGERTRAHHHERRHEHAREAGREHHREAREAGRERGRYNDREIGRGNRRNEDVGRYGEFGKGVGGNKEAGTPQQREMVLSQMVKGPVSPQQREQLMESLKNYDINTLAKLQQEGVSIKVASAAEVAARFNGRQTIAGYYDPREKSITLRADQVNDKVLIHELAHAEDDARLAGTATYRSENDPRLMGMYQNYMNRGNNGVWSAYARTDVSEYYAEGKAMFDTDPETLRRMDPALYAYIAMEA